MLIRIIDPNVKYAGIKLGDKNDRKGIKDIAVKLGVKEDEAKKILEKLAKKGLVEFVPKMTIQEIKKKKKAKPITKNIEVKPNVNSGIDSTV